MRRLTPRYEIDRAIQDYERVQAQKAPLPEPISNMIERIASEAKQALEMFRQVFTQGESWTG